MKTYLEFADGASHKFWEIELNGNMFTVRFGKVGTAGQAQEKYFDDTESAKKEAEKLIKSKTKKGYAEAAAPTGANAAVARPKASPADVMEAPKLKKRVLPAPGPDITEDTGRKISDEEFGADDEGFAFDCLRKPEVVDVKPQDERSGKKSPEAAAPEAAGYDEAAFNAARQELMKALKRGRGDCASILVENLIKAQPTEEQIAEVYQKAAKLIFSDDIYYVSLQSLEILPFIAGAGVDIAEIYNKADKDDVKPLLAKAAKAIAAKPGDVMAAINDTVKNFYNGIADIALEQLKEVVTDIKAGKHDTINGKKLPDGETGFMISADDPIAIYTAIGRNRLKKKDYEPADDIKGTVIKRYLSPALKPKLEKLLDEGFFTDISNGYLWLGLYGDSEAIAERRIDEKALQAKAVELEETLEKLETTDDFVHTVELYSSTVALYLNANGIIANKDTDRILALIKRFLYSGEEQAEEISRDLLNKYDSLDYGKWRHTFVSYIWDNMEHEWALDAMQRLVDSHAYQPAIDTLRQWRGEAPASTGLKADSCEGIDYEEVYGYGQSSRTAKHRDTFTENQLFAETDTFIARAFASGYIHIRFKQENERAYSEALDWLNALMAAGYSEVHDGYELRVYFLAEPVYFEEMRSLMDGYLWPGSDSHAFFCKAVRYPALRDKVADFARLTLNEFDRYLNLDGEFSTVAGTFAATAVSMADVKYMDVAVQYALETDGEHEQMASYFADILDDYWGVTPETAVAIALLRMSYDHDDLGLSDDFWKYPHNLEALADYFSTTRMHHKEHRIIRLANNIFGDAEDGLKKLKKLFKASGDSKAKEIYSNFHNMVLEALEEEEGDEYGKPIDFKVPAQKVERVAASAFKELPENPPCLITPAEAKKRGFSDEEFDHIDDASWCACVFAPLVITDPYIYDFIEANRQARSELSASCYTVFNPEMCYTFRKKIALDLRGAPYKFGMMIFDKKDATILYGLYDYCKLVSKVGNKKIDQVKLEALRDELMFMDCPQGSPVDDNDNPAVKLLDEASQATFDERYLRAVKKLERITPEAGEAYNASLIMMAQLMRKKGDKDALKKIYTEAAQRLPQHKVYWDEKLKGL